MSRKLLSTEGAAASEAEHESSKLSLWLIMGNKKEHPRSAEGYSWASEFYLVAVAPNRKFG